MQITAQNTMGPQDDRSVSLAWSRSEDPRGYLARLIESGQLVDLLAVVADPMEFANTDLLADRAEAIDRLRASVALFNLLLDRMGRLTVALRDSYGADWVDLAAILTPDAETPSLSNALHFYTAGRRTTGIPGSSADLPES